MKNRKSILICIALMLIFPVTSIWAVWEGNAGIASASEFPGSGMYARSDMFPKNTIVEIENLETEITIRAVITGTAGIPGLVAVLSPDTAAALNISPGSVSRVRISIPSPVAEKPAAGTVAAASATETADPDVNPAAAANTADTLKSVTDKAEDPLVPLASAETGPSSAAEPAPSVTAPAPAPVVAPPAAPVVAAESVTPKETPVVAEASENTAPATESEVPVTASEETPAATVAETELAAPAAESATPVVPEVAAVAAESEPAATEPPAASVTVAASDAAPVPAEPAVPSTVYDEPAVTVTPANSTAEVTLVPTDENPPTPAESPTTVDVPVAEPVVAETAPIPSPVETVAAVTTPVAVAPVVQPVPEVVAPVAVVQPVPAEAAFSPVTDSSLPFITSLDKGSFYIQIASCAEIANAKKLVDTYGKKYPVSVVRGAAKNGDIVKVYIGPVRKDEYGAMLERFRLLGFKDAFVKKGQ
jgi:hypothetical protein